MELNHRYQTSLRDGRFSTCPLVVISFWKFTFLIIFSFLMSNCSEQKFEPLFLEDGPPAGWYIRAWDDISNPALNDPVWKVKDGVLFGGVPRGSWLISEREYGDFIIEFEFKLGERGNSGFAIRAPLYGDPAFDGIELQMADMRYNPEALDSEITGGLYRAVAPDKQVYRPLEWNHYHIRCEGANIFVRLNGENILDVNLDEETSTVLRHDGTTALPLRDRPRRGHIGFQELSREEKYVQIRNAQLKVLD